MARITFVTWDGGGNVPPAIGIAQALATRHHHVHFLAYEGQRACIEAHGFTSSTLRRSGAFDVRAQAADQRLAALLRWVWACPEHVEDIPAELARHPADVLVVDFLMQGVLASTHRVAIPVAVLAHSAIAGLVPPPDSLMGAARLAAANQVRALVHLTPMLRLNDAWNQLLTLVTTVPELDPASAGRGPLVRYVGPIAAQFHGQVWHSPWDAGDNRPLILVSFSTTKFWDHRGRIRNTLDALADEPLRVLVSGHETADLGALPANAVARPFVPHALVLPHAALTITHCGHGTVAASLAYGVPVVGMPNRAADQPFLAARIQELGLGLALDGEAGAAEIRAAVREVLTQPSFSEAARRMAAIVGGSLGASGAAVELERLVSPHS